MHALGSKDIVSIDKANKRVKEDSDTGSGDELSISDDLVLVLIGSVNGVADGMECKGCTSTRGNGFRPNTAPNSKT